MAGDEVEERWPMTPRTTYIVLLAVELIAEQLRTDIDALGGQALTRGMLTTGDPHIHQMDAFPPQTWAQPVPWWQEMAKAAERIADELRADHWWYAPRTPAEEAVIYVATQQAEDVLDMWGPESTPADSPELNKYRDHLLSLPTDSTSDDDERLDDFVFAEVLAAMSGDEDIVLAWTGLRRHR